MDTLDQLSARAVLGEQLPVDEFVVPQSLQGESGRNAWGMISRSNYEILVCNTARNPSHSFAFRCLSQHLTPRLVTHNMTIDVTECDQSGNSTDRSAVSPNLPTEALDTLSGYLGDDLAFQAIIQTLFSGTMYENDPRGSWYPGILRRIGVFRDYLAMASNPRSNSLIKRRNP